MESRQKALEYLVIKNQEGRVDALKHSTDDVVDKLNNLVSRNEALRDTLPGYAYPIVDFKVRSMRDVGDAIASLYAVRQELIDRGDVDSLDAARSIDDEINTVIKPALSDFDTKVKATYYDGEGWAGKSAPRVIVDVGGKPVDATTMRKALEFMTKGRDRQTQRAGDSIKEFFTDMGLATAIGLPLGAPGVAALTGAGIVPGSLAEEMSAEASAAGDLINRATEALGESVKGVIRDVTPRPKLR